MATTVTPRAMVQWAGLVGGPVLGGACYLVLPESYHDATGGLIEFTTAGRTTLAIMTWMAVWWLTEAIDISATALLPIALLPALGATTIGEATAPYADKLIFLFLGGFLLALSMQRWGLDRRIALFTLRFTGDRPAGIVAGIMLATNAAAAITPAVRAYVAGSAGSTPNSSPPMSRVAPKAPTAPNTIPAKARRRLQWRMSR